MAQLSCKVLFTQNKDDIPCAPRQMRCNSRDAGALLGAADAQPLWPRGVFVSRSSGGLVQRRRQQRQVTQRRGQRLPLLLGLLCVPWISMLPGIYAWAVHNALTGTSCERARDFMLRNDVSLSTFLRPLLRTLRGVGRFATISAAAQLVIETVELTTGVQHCLIDVVRCVSL